MTIARILVSLIAAVAVGIGASYAVPATVGDTISTAAPYGWGFIAFAVTYAAYGLLGSRRNSRPTGMSRPMPPTLHRGGTPTTARNAVTGTTSAPPKPKRMPAPAPVVDNSVNAAVEPVKFKVGSGESYLEVSSAPVDGGVQITVVCVGYSGSEFKQRIRPRIENVRQVKWQNPTNLGERRRQIVGTVAGGNPNQALAAIRGISA